MEGGDEGSNVNSSRESVNYLPSPSVAVERPTEYIIEFQVKSLFIPEFSIYFMTCLWLLIDSIQSQAEFLHCSYYLLVSVEKIYYYNIRED